MVFVFVYVVYGIGKCPVVFTFCTDLLSIKEMYDTEFYSSL